MVMPTPASATASASSVTQPMVMVSMPIAMAMAAPVPIPMQMVQMPTPVQGMVAYSAPVAVSRQGAVLDSVSEGATYSKSDIPAGAYPSMGSRLHGTGQC